MIRTLAKTSLLASALLGCEGLVFEKDPIYRNACSSSVTGAGGSSCKGEEYEIDDFTDGQGKYWRPESIAACTTVEPMKVGLRLKVTSDGTAQACRLRSQLPYDMRGARMELEFAEIKQGPNEEFRFYLYDPDDNNDGIFLDIRGEFVSGYVNSAKRCVDAENLIKWSEPKEWKGYSKLRVRDEATRVVVEAFPDATDSAKWAYLGHLTHDRLPDLSEVSIEIAAAVPDGAKPMTTSTAVVKRLVTTACPRQ
jgi:hypothetical protein